MEYSVRETTAKAFELAYFIHLERNLALEILTDALSALQAQLKSQQKRFYYILRGRNAGGMMVRSRTKITQEESQKLQSLIYEYSERVERRQEQAILSGQSDSLPRQPCRAISEEDWLVRFIKHLMAITVTRSSFYVTIAVARIVCTYTTEHATRIYDAVIQDANRMKDAPYFRKQKNDVLMKGLKERFHTLLRTQVAAHGEQRFLSRSDGEKFLPLIRHCLDLFTPWNTECLLPVNLDPIGEPINELYFKDGDPDKEHPMEARRMHILIHPNCFDRLTMALDLDAPNERYEVPMFFVDQSAFSSESGGGQSGGNPPSSRPTPAPLASGDLAHLELSLKRQSKRRQRARPEIVRILIDGVERGILNPNRESVNIRVKKDARLIELKSHDTQGELLLGSLLLDHRTLLSAIPLTLYRLQLGNKQELLVTLSATLDAEGEVHDADLAIAFRKTQRQLAISELVAGVTARARFAFRNPAWVFSTMAIVLTTLAVGGVWYRRQPRTVEYVTQVQNQGSPSSPDGSSQAQSKQHRPEGQHTPPSEVTKTPRPEASSKIESKPIRRVQEGTRGPSGALAQELKAVRRVHVQPRSADAEGNTEVFSKAINVSGKLSTSDAASADAFLVWKLQRGASHDRIEVQVVSRSGQTLWTSSRLVRPDRSATIGDLVRDLIAAIMQ